MERCDLNLLIDKTQHLLYKHKIEAESLVPAASKVEVQKLKGDDGKIYTLSVLLELYDPTEERKTTANPSDA